MNTSSLGPRLTDYEIEALSRTFNFADGHARNNSPQSHSRAVERLVHFMSGNLDQDEAESSFAEAFFDLAGQGCIGPKEILFCPSASISIEIIANYLRLHHLSVALIQPVFDNLAGILTRQHVPTYPCNEESLRNLGVQNYLLQLEADAVFLVIPNNPTGFVLTGTDFRTLVESCIDQDKLLILDFSFRFFSPELVQWSQYEYLQKSGVRYIAIEDTGKTWATYELKASCLTADQDTFSHLRLIYRDIFLCISPLTLIFVEEFIKTSKEKGITKTILEIVEVNRKALHSAIANTPLRPVALRNGSVEWIRIDDDLEDLDLVHGLEEYGIYILPGRNFFWSSPESNKNFVRVALMRDVELFRKGMDLFNRVLPLVLKTRDGRAESL